jgi:hypothetical protein
MAMALEQHIGIPDHNDTAQVPLATGVTFRPAIEGAVVMPKIVAGTVHAGQFPDRRIDSLQVGYACLMQWQLLH